MNAAELVKKYIEIRDYLKKKAEEREREDAPYTSAMTAIEGALTMEMDRLECDSIKTEFGTPYRSTILAARVSDRESFIDFVAQTSNFDFFTAAIAKEAVKAYMDDHGGAAPPGVDIAYIKKLNIRRS